MDKIVVTSTNEKFIVTESYAENKTFSDCIAGLIDYYLDKKPA